MLGWSRDRDREVAFTRAFKLTPMMAGLVSRLYAARGRVLTAEALSDSLSFVPGRLDHAGVGDEAGLIKVMVSKLRKRVGADAVETVWRRGYRLTETGLALCDAALAKFGGAS